MLGHVHVHAHACITRFHLMPRAVGKTRVLLTHAADMAYAASVDAMFPAPVHVPSAAVRAPRSGFRRAQMIASAPNLIKRTVLGSAQIDAPKETAWRRASAANRDVLGPKIVRELES